MKPGGFSTIVLPAFANAGMITVTINSDIASGSASSAAALVAGTYFVMTGEKDRYQCASTPIDIGGGVFNFHINRSPSSTMTKQAWSITQEVDEDTLGLIYSHDDAGNTAGRAAHDAAADGYVYLDTQAARIWERNGPAGTWTDAATTIVLWVSPTGSDTDPTVEQLRTVQAAVDRVADAGDLTGWNVIIALKSTTYNETVTLKDVEGTPATLKICDELALASVAADPIAAVAGVTHGFTAIGIRSVWLIEHIAMAASKGHCLLAKAARLRFNRCQFLTATGTHLNAMGGGHIVLAGDGYKISAGANAHLAVNGSGGTIDLQVEATVPKPTITISAGFTFTTAFAWARASGQIFTGTGLTFTGKANVLGRRWRAEQNSSIDTGQSGEKYLPGNQAGIAVKSGEYI